MLRSGRFYLSLIFVLQTSMRVVFLRPTYHMQFLNMFTTILCIFQRKNVGYFLPWMFTNVIDDVFQ